MRKLVKFALLGGTVGVAVTMFKGNGASADQSEDTTSQALRVGGSAAAAGAPVGFVLDRRPKKKAKRTGRLGAVRSGGESLFEAAAEAAKSARPVLEHAVELARPRVEHAAEAAREAASDLVDQARPHVKTAAKKTRKRAERARKDMRKQAERARKDVRKQAEELASQAKDALAERTPVIVKVA